MDAESEGIRFLKLKVKEFLEIVKADNDKRATFTIITILYQLIHVLSTHERIVNLDFVICQYTHIFHLVDKKRVLT